MEKDGRSRGIGWPRTKALMSIVGGGDGCGRG